MYKIISLQCKEVSCEYQVKNTLPYIEYLSYGMPDTEGVLTIVYEDGSQLTGPIKNKRWVSNSEFSAIANEEGHFHFPNHVEGVVIVLYKDGTSDSWKNKGNGWHPDSNE